VGFECFDVGLVWGAWEGAEFAVVVVGSSQVAVVAVEVEGPPAGGGLR
jgi:hypothetical protein